MNRHAPFARPRYVGTYVRVTSQGSPYSRFQRALATGNVALVRAAAAELPRIGVAEAAAMLLVIEHAEPDRYERAARRWLAMLCEERQSSVDLLGLAQAAAALDALPSRRPAACAALAAVCERAGLKDAARVFTS
jgi:hypothetical protein